MISSRIINTVCGDSDTGWRLDYWLAQRYTYQSRQQWQQHIRAGQIQVDGNLVKTAHRVRSGEQIEYLPPALREPEVDMNWQIIYEDDDLIGINKSGNLPTHPGGCYFLHTLWWQLRQQKSGDLRMINRLDRETSGLVLIAKNRKAAQELSRQFQTHTVRKEYLVIVEGDFPPSLHASGFLYPDYTSRVKKKRRFGYADEGNGDAANTEFHCLAKRGRLSVLRALPHTGKTHQIRATLSSLGYPVVGDKLYGMDDRLFLAFITRMLTPEELKKLRLPRQALHACTLTFSHPVSSHTNSLSADIPDDLNVFIHDQGLYASLTQSFITSD